MNKKVIRLTENDLHNIVKESVKKILTEIGDTPKGQYMLGRAAERSFQKDRGNYDDIKDYFHNSLKGVRRKKRLERIDNYNQGRNDEDDRINNARVFERAYKREDGTVEHVKLKFTKLYGKEFEYWVDGSDDNMYTYGIIDTSGKKIINYESSGAVKGELPQAVLKAMKTFGGYKW